MATLAPHPFEPLCKDSREYDVCDVCKCRSASRIHDWLSPITPEEMVQLPNLLTHDAPINAPVHHVFCTCPLCVEWVAKQRTRIGNTPDVGTDDDDATIEDVEKGSC
jgi:hypothetical protein